jgi:hypothetical protein
MSVDDSTGTPETDVTVLRARAELLEAALQESRDQAARRLIQAELKAEAWKNGMIDLDGLKLIDANDIAVDDSGEVKGAAAVVARLRRSKPWLFGAPSSSSHAGVPASAPTRQKLATEMSLDEWRNARAELLRRR